MENINREILYQAIELDKAILEKERTVVNHKLVLNADKEHIEDLTYKFMCEQYQDNIKNIAEMKVDMLRCIYDYMGGIISEDRLLRTMKQIEYGLSRI